jgi:Insertion element 4 transposase N-terminal/Transposase DDE domain
LEQTRTVQRRLRDLPSRVRVYFVLALGLFPRLGYARVWGKLTAGLAGLPVACPSEKALRDLRRRLGPAPLKALFEVVAGPLAQPHTPGIGFGGMRTVAFDGCNSLKAPDTERNRWWLGRIRYRMGFAGYPTLRLMALAETGTRGLLGAALGSAADRDEASVARRLLHLLRPGMLVLLDRAFDANAFLGEVAATGAALLARSKSTRHPPVLGHLPDGSYLSCLDGLAVRIIEADMRITGADGSRVADRYRLITTLTDHRLFPAAAVVRLYHERWEIESAYFALRHTLLEGHVLRSGDRPGLEQETWALLTRCQLLRMAMVTATETRPGTDPDRASFTTALQAAGEELTAARGICPGGPPDLTGAIGRAVLATLLPARRRRYSARKVKCATSRYLNRDDGRPATPAAITAIGITICTPPLDLKPGRTRRDRSTPTSHGRPGRPPGGSVSPPSWPPSRTATGPAVNSPNASRSPPATCTPSSANGPSSASSPAPASPPTRSTHHQPIPSRQPGQPLNFAALTREELQRFLDYADEQVDRAARAKRKGALAAYRDATLFKVIYGWGLRRAETARLDLADWGRNPAAAEFGRFGMLHVRYGKAVRGQPPRRRNVASVMGWAVEAVADYVDNIRPRFGAIDHPALWVTERGGRIKPAEINVRFVAYRDALGLPGRCRRIRCAMPMSPT